jgi:hypothetical protein
MSTYVPALDGSTFVKVYRDRGELDCAARNAAWLRTLSPPARLPHVLGIRALDMVMERIPGRHVEPRDLTAVAAHLGEVHATALRRGLDDATLAEDLSVATPLGTHRLPGFLAGRLDAVTVALESGAVPSPMFDASTACAHIRNALQLPVSFYKDMNPRNVLMPTNGPELGPVMVDFDTITLAPPGYDLAKLAVGLAMTHGRLSDAQLVEAIDAYNAAMGPESVGVSLDHFTIWTEIHHILTSRYLGRHGYRHSWHLMRPFGDSVYTSARRTTGRDERRADLGRQLYAPDPVGRDLELFRTRSYRFTDDLNVYIFGEALVDRWLDGRRPNMQTMAYVRDSLDSIRRWGIFRRPDTALLKDIDFDAELDRRSRSTNSHHLADQPPDLVVAVVGAPRSGTSHLVNVLAQTGEFAYFTTASCWAWPTHHLHDQRRTILDAADPYLAQAILRVDNRRTRTIPALVMPGEAEDTFARAMPVYRHLGGHRYWVDSPRTGRLELLSRGVQAHMSHFSSTRFLTKSPFHAFRISHFEALWPERVRYLHIVRSRTDVAKSIRENGFEYWFGERPTSAEEARDRFVLAVQREAPPDRTMTLSHAELVEDATAVVDRVHRWLEV